MGKPKRAALYVRVSTDGQTVDNQRLALEAVCEQRGWQVVQVYADNGISGAKGRKQRPGLDALLKDASRGRFNVVLAWGICSSRLNDRFSIQDGTNCLIRIGTPSCCGAKDGSNAGEQIGSPIGTKSTRNLSVCGCGPQFPLAAIVIRWNFRMLQECKQVAAHLAVSFS